MSRQDLQRLVEAWDPTGDVDLPDEVAAALDADPDFRAWFDARFERWSAGAEQPAPDGLADRVIPSAPRSRRALWWGIGLGVSGLAVAASALVVVGSMLSVGATSYGPPVSRRMQQDTGGAEAPLLLASPKKHAKPAIRPESSDGELAERLALIYPGGEEGEQDATVTLVKGGKKEAQKLGGDRAIDLPGQPDDAPVAVNGFETAATDSQSTFSVDVDAGSYTQARRALRSGYLPSPSAVRVEEFVNFFPYDYAPPADGAFAVHVEGAPSPWGGTQLVRIGLQGKRMAADKRGAAHLVFLVDVSGSMSGDDRLGLVQKSLKMLVAELRDGDTVALVVYAGKSGVVLEPTPVTDSKAIDKAIDRLSAGGSTAMGDGIHAAYELAARTYEPGATNRVIIASDGDANVGVTDTAELTKLIAGFADRGITLTTLGFGEGNYRDQRMEQLANDGDGNYYYVDSEAEARRVLVDRMTSTLEVIARDVKLQVDWNPKAVTRYRLLGYENRAIADRDFTNDKVDAGEVGAGHQVTAIYEVELAKKPVGELFTLAMRAKAPGPEAPSVETKWSFEADVLRPSLGETSADFRVALAAATFAERLRGSEYAHLTYAEIGALLAATRRVEYAEDAELAELIGIASRLQP